MQNFPGVYHPVNIVSQQDVFFVISLNKIRKLKTYMTRLRTTIKFPVSGVNKKKAPQGAFRNYFRMSGLVARLSFVNYDSSSI